MVISNGLLNASKKTGFSASVIKSLIGGIKGPTGSSIDIIPLVHWETEIIWVNATVSCIHYRISVPLEV